MRAYERFLNYVKVYTTSDPDSATAPSSARQLDLARQLADEMTAMGIERAHVDEFGIVYGWLSATPGMEDVPALGFIAHMDTAPDLSGKDVRPQIIEHYDGGDVLLAGSGHTLSPDAFPSLKKLAGMTLITTDGTTLLGADDKAGIAEILTAAEQVIASGAPHGRLCFAFTPDEEVGSGVDHFDVAKFGAAAAYTVDGGEEGEIAYETFNACSADVTVTGLSVHPGSSKDTMINAALVAMEFNALLPAADIPRMTEGYEGFFHLCSMSGNVEKAALEYIVRDHSATMFDARLETLRHIQKLINEKYGEGTVELTIREQYRNMIEMIRPCIQVVDYAKEAIREAGLEPIVEPIRGGTDGARLSYMGLPCPNLGTGGYAAHGPYEHVTVEGMEKCTEILVNIVKRYAKA